MAELVVMGRVGESGRTRSRLLALGAVGAVVLTGCSSDSEDTEPTSQSGQVATSSQPRPEEPLAIPVPQDKWVDFTFDYLEGNSTIIRTYDTPYQGGDAHAAGTYPDGETHQAACKVEEGRSVASVPPETLRERNEFVLFYDGSEINFASATYIESPDQVLDKLEPCPAEFLPD